MAKIAAIILIMVPILLLTGIGAIDTNLTASGFSTVNAVTPCTSLQCPAFQAVGCQENASNCKFSTKTTYTFLNPNSPFTILLQGNLIGFFTYTFNTRESPQIIYSAYSICIPQVKGVYANNTGTDIHFFQCLGYSSQGGNASVTPQYPTVNVPLNATSNNGNNSQWNIVGCARAANYTYPCTLGKGGIEAWIGTNSEMSFYGFYIANGTTITATNTCHTFIANAQICGQLLPYLFHLNNLFQCPNTSHVNGVNINETTYYCLIPVANPTVGTAGNASLPNSFAGLSFLFGVILFFLGFGLAITSAIIGFSINQAGTRMAQVFGFGILVFSFIDGEFGFWATDNVLGFGVGTALMGGLAAMFFVGLYWLTESYF